MSIRKTENKVAQSASNLLLEEIVIKPWIKNLIPERTKEETDYLVADIDKHGQKLKAIVSTIDEEIVLIDGHGRYEALKQLGKSRIKVEFRNELQTEQQIKEAMLRIQLGRRNISENAKARLRAEILQQKTNLDKNSTKKKIAEELEVTDRTLRNDAKFNANCKMVEEIYPQAKAFLENKNTPKTVAATLSKLAKEIPEKIPAIVEELFQEKSKDSRSNKLKEIVQDFDISSDNKTQTVKTEKLKELTLKIPSDLHQKLMKLDNLESIAIDLFNNFLAEFE